MECPKCGYKDGSFWENDKYYEVDGEHGGFYNSPVKLTRRNDYSYCANTDEVSVYGCPNPDCRAVFTE